MYLQDSTVRLGEGFEIPLLPLRSTDDLPDALHKFHRSFLQGNSTQQTSTRSQSMEAVQSLLPYSGMSPPLCQHTTNIVSTASPTVRFILYLVFWNAPEGIISGFIADH
jgi:hypothetical protein